MNKVDRAKHGPGWGEVILGAILSLILGVVVGAVLLVLKPVVTANEVPKDPVPGTVYYVQGLPGNPTRAKQAVAKRQAFVQGQSVKVTEEELNSLAAALTAPATPDAKTGQPAAPAKSDETLATGTPNVRIRNGIMQIGVPITLNVFGLQEKVIAQARGGFARDGNVFVYDPNEVYLGSCPVQRIPFLSSLIREKLTRSQKVPDDLAAAWTKLANVSIEGNTLNLAMQ